MMLRYEVQTADGTPLGGIMSDRRIMAAYDKAQGAVVVAEVDTLGRRLPKGVRWSLGLDPMMEWALVLVVTDKDGQETWRDEVEHRGEPDPSTVRMPEDDLVDGPLANGSGEQ